MMPSVGRCALLFPLALGAGWVVAADAPALPASPVYLGPRIAVEPQPPEECSIGLAPQEARARSTDLFRLAATGDVRAREEWSNLKPPHKALALQRVLAHGPAPLRQSALKEVKSLSAEDDPDGKMLPALVQAALRDEEHEIRTSAMQEVLQRGDPRTPRLLARRLASGEPEERKRTVAALKAIGGPKVYEALVEHWRETWGPGPRAHMLVAKQRSYIADYDISGDAYDPVIRQFLEGVVLDVKPLLAFADIYILKALREVSGQDFGNDRKAWEKWLEEEKARKLIRD